jgi:hypothetical protein
MPIAANFLHTLGNKGKVHKNSEFGRQFLRGAQ